MAKYTCKEAEKVGRQLGYPSYSSALHSAASRPEESGVRWVSELQRVFGDRKPSVAKREEKRVKCHGWRVRLSPEANSLLNGRMKRLGYSTKQAYLERVLMLELSAERRYREMMEEVNG